MSYIRIGGGGGVAFEKGGGKRLQPDFVCCYPSSQLKVLGVFDSSSCFHHNVGMMRMFIGLPFTVPTSLGKPSK
jgi:hypothetical protein